MPQFLVKPVLLLEILLMSFLVMDFSLPVLSCVQSLPADELGELMMDSVRPLCHW